MKKILATAILAFSFNASNAQEINFIEYDLDNGLHVILHQDNTAPVITTAVSYHVGSKDEEEGRTGFAHFFEHLLFEGTKNIKGGEWFKLLKQMVAPIMHIHQTIKLIIMRYSPQINWSLVYGWNLKECFTQ